MVRTEEQWLVCHHKPLFQHREHAGLRACRREDLCEGRRGQGAQGDGDAACCQLREGSACMVPRLYLDCLFWGMIRHSQIVLVRDGQRLVHASALSHSANDACPKVLSVASCSRPSSTCDLRTTIAPTPHPRIRAFLTPCPPAQIAD